MSFQARNKYFHRRTQPRLLLTILLYDEDRRRWIRGGRLLLTVRPEADPTAKARMRFLKSECDMSENHHQETNTQSPAISKCGGTQTEKRAMDTIPFAQRLSCTVAEACAATGLGRTKLYELIGAGSVVTTLIGRRRLISVKSLLHLIAPEASTQIRG